MAQTVLSASIFDIEATTSSKGNKCIVLRFKNYTDENDVYKFYLDTELPSTKTVLTQIFNFPNKLTSNELWEHLTKYEGYNKVLVDVYAENPYELVFNNNFLISATKLLKRSIKRRIILEAEAIINPRIIIEEC